MLRTHSIKKTNLEPDVTCSNTVNLDICMPRFVILGYIISGSRLIFYGTKVVYLYFVGSAEKLHAAKHKGGYQRDKQNDTSVFLT